MNETSQTKSKKGLYKKLLLAAIILSVALVLLYYKLPIRGAAEKQIVGILKSYGLNVHSLKVESLGDSGAVLTKISLGDGKLLEVEEIKAEYDIRKIFDKQAKNIIVKNTKLNIYKKDGQLVAGGLEPLMGKQPDYAGGNNIIFDGANLRKFVSDKIVISQLHASALSDNSEFAGTVDLSVNMQPQVALEASGKDWQLRMKPYQIRIDQFILKSILDEKARLWHGNAILGNIIISGTPSEIPPLEAKGDFTYSENDFGANIDINDAKKTTTASLKLDKTNLKINYARIPWGGGRISTNNITLPLIAGKNPTAFVVQVDKVELSSILGILSDGKITGQGKLSGTFPIVYYPDGRIVINNGSAVSIENGIINVSPTLLAGDNQQLQMARELLQNFHYTKLRIAVSSKEDKNKGKTLVSLVLEGNNPNAFEGKKVNFSINITGDVLPLLQQSVLPFNDIKQLMELKDKK